MVKALLVGAAVLIAGILAFGMAIALLMQVIVRLIQRGYGGPILWKNVVVMIVITLITAAMHLSVIALWGVTLQVCGEMATFEQAFYVSAVNYTALGYGDILLSERWRILGPIEAINGLLFFGLSTAVLFAVLSRLLTNRLRQDLGQGKENPSD
jgi:hypothetical protein